MFRLPKRAFALSFKHVRLSFGSPARTKLAYGMRVLAEVTAKTYGPGGRNVALEYEYGDPKITKDGVTVAKSVFFKDREEELGAKLLKRIANSTNTYAGDGTTLSTFFSSSLVNKAVAAIDSGAHPFDIKQGIEKSRKATLDILNQFVMPVTNKKELLDVCMVSSNYREDIASIVSEAISAIDISNGFEGNLEIEESKSGTNELLITKGMFIQRGFVSEEFCQTGFGNPVLSDVTLDYPLILVVNDYIEENEHIVKIMEMAVKHKRPLLLFSTDLRPGPLSAMLYNAKNNVLGCCAVNVPFLAGKEEDMLKDIAVLTGAKIIENDGVGEDLDDIRIDQFGTATKVIVTDINTQIIGGGGSKESIEEHKEFIKHQISIEDSKHFNKVYKDRLTRLNSLQAVIGVGGETEAIKGENRDLIVDSLNSARAALETGILPGGGISLYHASKLIPLYADVNKEDENVGIKIFQESLREAVQRIITNAIGEDRVGHILEQINDSNDFLMGYNVKSEKVENLMEAGVVDSLKVIKSVLEDSVNLCNMIIMTECNVIKRKEYVPQSLEHHQQFKEPF